jgi:hypothetical protein
MGGDIWLLSCPKIERGCGIVGLFRYYKPVLTWMCENAVAAVICCPNASMTSLTKPEIDLRL